MKKVFFVVMLLWTLGFVYGHSSAEPWYKVMWTDINEHSNVNLGKNVAWGYGHDFISGKNYQGGIFSIWQYRFFHIEYGLLDVVREKGPISHTLGGSVYVKPFIKWARIPDDYIAIKQLYIGGSARYDLHRWGVLLLAHLTFGLSSDDGKVWGSAK